MPMERRGKEQEASGSNSLVVTRLNCPLCQHGTILLQNCAQVNLFFCPLPSCIYSGAKSELLSNILGFYFCYPLSCPPKKRVFTQWRFLLTYARRLKRYKMIIWCWAQAVLLMCCCWKQGYANRNTLLARCTWYLYTALSCVNICTELPCLCSVLGCLLLTYPPFPLLLEVVSWGPDMKAFQLQHLINEILTSQMQSVAALSTSITCSNAHGVPGKSYVLLSLNLLGSLRNRNGSKTEWLCGFWAKLERKGKERNFLLSCINL